MEALVWGKGGGGVADIIQTLSWSFTPNLNSWWLILFSGILCLLKEETRYTIKSSSCKTHLILSKKSCGFMKPCAMGRILSQIDRMPTYDELTLQEGKLPT
ncbi:hypothetical protein Dimus_000233 [Dionaea muscipula]